MKAVHEVRSWDDLRNRLDADRRVYAFFHPKMPKVPLIFVEVALTHGMSAGIGALLDESAPPARPLGSRYRGLLFDLQHPAGIARASASVASC